VLVLSGLFAWLTVVCYADLTSSSTASLIFIFLPLYFLVVAGIVYLLGIVVHRTARWWAGRKVASKGQPSQSEGA
jgi:hypothetical protein